MQWSSDGATLTDVFVVDTYLREGWNTYTPNSNHHRTFDAEYIYVSIGAFFETETKSNRYKSKWTITMHGAKESAQLPTYGNKGIFLPIP